MKFIFCIIFSIFCFSASAQWSKLNLPFKLSFRKKQERPQAIVPVAIHSIARLPSPQVTSPPISAIILKPSEYSYLVAEAFVIKKAQHNMGAGTFYDASYNFSDLARLYMEHKKLSEAKWYLLQSNNISRQQNDYRHTMLNLIDLSMVKEKSGDKVQALQDLTEARGIAKAKSFNEELIEIDQKIFDIKKSMEVPQKLRLQIQKPPVFTMKPDKLPFLNSKNVI